MSNAPSREVVLLRYPNGLPEPSDFEIVERQLAAPGDGEVQVRNLFMSVDPYMRGRMSNRESYVPGFALNEALTGGAVGQVTAAGKATKLKPGDHVLSMFGWREAFNAPEAGLVKIDPTLGPAQSYLGALGMPGHTAYAGLIRIAGLKEGDTVFVSAASGAVGSIVCQIAKARGHYVIGSAGSDEKCQWLEREAGVDKAINYKTEGNLDAAVAAAFPKGIDVYFENVGGAHLTAALNNMAIGGRIAVCGMIEQYNATGMPAGPYNFIMTVPRRIKIEGFIVSDHNDLLPAFHADMGQWIAAGKMKWKESIYDGIDKAPEAFLGLFKGENFGKALVKLS